MPTSSPALLLSFANVQMAAEALWQGLLPTTHPEYPNLVLAGLQRGNTHASKFTPSAATEFLSDWDVIAHKSNTPTGFSATLFRAKRTDVARGLVAGEYTLSFRSTEFVDDAVQDVFATNKLELAEMGWAFGQIADMEMFYRDLRTSALPTDAKFNVTGYSLGGHLATAFTILRQEEAQARGVSSPVKDVYTFNGAGVGGLTAGTKLTDVLKAFNEARATPSVITDISIVEQGNASRNVAAILAEKARVDVLPGIPFADGKPPVGIQATLDYQLAAIVASRRTTAAVGFPVNRSVNYLPSSVVLAPSLMSNMIEVFGADRGRADTSLGHLQNLSFTAFSGLHYGQERVGVYVEDQPFYRGDYLISGPLVAGRIVANQPQNDYADTHSLVLLVDSLSLTSALAALDPTLTIDRMQRLLALASDTRGSAAFGTQGKAEGDTLEKALDVLRRLILGPSTTATPFSLDGNTWQNIDLRNQFHNNLKALQADSRYASRIGRLKIELITPESLLGIATSGGEHSRAARYALKELNPFIITGDPKIYDQHDASGELQIYDPLASPNGNLSREYLIDRAAFLNWKNVKNSLDTQDVLVQRGLPWPIRYLDLRDRYSVSLRGLTDVPQTAARAIVFGTDGSDAGSRAIGGSLFSDRLYGGGGNDELDAGAGDDYLEGNSGNDDLKAGAGADTLIGGKGNDTLRGGVGADVYVVGQDQDTIIDDDGQGIVLDTRGRRIGGLFVKKGSQYVFTSNPGIVATFNTTFTVFLDGGATVTIENFKQGALGISLADPKQALSPITTPTTLISGSDLVSNRLVAPAAGATLEGKSRSDYLVGGAGNDKLIGGAGTDWLSGNLGSNRIEAGAGNDVIVLGQGADWADGGADGDFITYLGGDKYPVSLDNVGGAFGVAWTPRVSFDTATGARSVSLEAHVTGGPLSMQTPIKQQDFLTRVAFTVVNGQEIRGGGGGDVINAGPGDDLIYGDRGAGAPALTAPTPGEADAADFILAGAGNDTVFAEGGGDTVLGADGADYLDGGAGDDWMLGDAGDDVLIGAAGIDTLFGDAPSLPLAQHGADYLDGGDGNDFLWGGGGGDSLFGGEGDDQLSGDDSSVALASQGADYLDGEGGNDLLLGYGGDDELFGGAGIDELQGHAGDDYLDGEDGDDLLFGDEGNDQLFGGEGKDGLAAGTGDDYADGEGGDDLIHGEAGNDDLSGGDGSDAISGGAGADVINGDAGVDLLNGDDGDDALYGGAGADQLAGDLGNDALFGGADGDILEAGNGNDLLEGGAGNDALIGGQGNDIYVFRTGDGSDTIRDTVDINRLRFADVANAAGLRVRPGVEPGSLTIEYGGAGDAVFVIGSFTGSIQEIEFADGTLITPTALFNTLEELAITGTAGDDVLTTTFPRSRLDGGAGNDRISGSEGPDVLLGGTGMDVLTGHAGPDQLDGGADDDRLDGGAGADTMRGGAGRDTYIVDSADDVVIEEPAAGVDTVISSVTHALALNVENLTLTGADAINGTGNADSNTIIGNAAGNTLSGNGGNDILDGGSGADTLVGGAGDDVYIVDSAADIIVETTGEGTDSVQSSVSYGLSANVENLTLTGAAIDATGNAAANVLTGNAVGNMLNGGAGADTMIGAAGDDVYIVGDAGDVVVENAGGGVDTVFSSISYVLGENVERLALLGDQPISATGNAGDNLLTGNAAANRLAGGAGNDFYVVDTWDVVVENANEGVDTVQSASTYTIGANVERLTLTGGAIADATGNALDNLLIGNTAANVLTALAGNDVLDGGAGADRLVGGLGNDVYVVDNVGDVVVELVAEGVDTVQSAVTYVLAPDVENLTLTGAAAIGGTGNALDNLLAGNAANNSLTGGAGNDTLNGGAGADAMSGGLGNDLYVVDNALDAVVENLGEGTDTVQSAVGYMLSANVENLTLTGTAIDATGSAAANVLTGNAVGNMLNGGAGADTMIGAAGDDVYIVGDAGDVVVENAGGGVDTVFSSISYALGDNVERLALLGDQSINATGNGGDNLLSGNAAANRLAGGAGNDFYVVDTWDVVVENANEGVDTVQSASTYTIGANVERLTLTGGAIADATGNALDNLLIGNTAANVLTALAGSDVLDGGAGADRLVGGAGNDIYVVDNIGDVVVELAAEGVDTVKSSVAYGLASDIENLTLTGAAAIAGAGNALDNLLIGNAANNSLAGGAGNDTLNGGAGADALAGGLGNDRYVLDNALDTVVENIGEGVDTVEAAFAHTLSANVENLTLIGSAALSGGGNELDNTIVGNAAGNSLAGGAGNDTLDGGAGADVLSGDAGNDTYVVDNAGDVVIEAAGAGTDTVRSAVTLTLGANVENLTLTGAAAIGAVGNVLDNVIAGNAAANRIDGGAGLDTMAGGAGDDIYVVDRLGDVVVESANEGVDTVETEFSYTIGANVENLTLRGAAGLNATGNALDNVIAGNDGANRLAGGAGNDTYVVTLGDTVVENPGDGIDTVRSPYSYTLEANVENATVIDSSLNNSLEGRKAHTIALWGEAKWIEANRGGITTFLTDEWWRLDFADAIGNGANNVLIGGSGRNWLQGGAGNDFLDGGGGSDILLGGAGDDTYVIDAEDHALASGGFSDWMYATHAGAAELAGGGNDTVQVSFSYTLLDNFENLTLAGAAAIDGRGNAVGNVLIGNSASNRLDGGAGSDAMRGGAGNDTYVVDTAGDTVVEFVNEGLDAVETGLSYTLGAHLENLTLTGSAAVNGTGNAANNVLAGNDANNVLDGMAGADTLSGGLGDDTYVVDSAAEVVVENAAAGTDTVQTTISYTLGASVENLLLGGSAAVNGTGNILNNRLVGNLAGNTLVAGAGNDTLDGGAGADILDGGTGNDTYVVDTSADVIVENPGAGIDTLQSAVTYTLSANLENLALTGTASINGTGNDGANLLTGNAAANILSGGLGNDTLDGASGTDTLVGGAGDDTYTIDTASDAVVEQAGEGVDGIRSAAAAYALAANVENLALVGNARSGIGNALNNVLTGNAFDNVLDGGAGADTMSGGFGSDTYVIDHPADVIVEDASPDVEWLAALGVQVVEHSTSESNPARLRYARIVDPGPAAISLLVSLGFAVAPASTEAGVTYRNIEAAPAQADTVQTAGSYTLGANLENVTLTGASAASATGNALANTLTGNAAANALVGLAGNDRLDGGAGIDTLTGGVGNDTYVLDSAADVLVELAGEGVDSVEAACTYTLGAMLENLTLTGTAAIDGAGNAADNALTGNAAANALTGGAGNDTLDGGAGIDTLAGGAGNDSYIVAELADVIVENPGEGVDVVRSAVSYALGANVENLTLTGAAIDGTGSALDNVLIGNSAANTLRGEAGNDTLHGGEGGDTLVGGLGDDTYYVPAGPMVFTGERFVELAPATVVVENPGEGVDTVITDASTYTLAANVENLRLSSGWSQTGIGNALNNAISGTNGFDTLDGGAGADTMEGGAGGDTYHVDNIGDVVVDAAGVDMVNSSVTYVLVAAVENLTLTGSAAINGAGNGGNNVIAGNVGSNVLDAGDGNDTLSGGGGFDTLSGGLGNDSLGEPAFGALRGAETMSGGAGDDTYTVDVAGDVAVENAGEGVDTVVATISYALGANVENLRLSMFANHASGTGNALANQLFGNDFNNVLDGGAGADHMAGGTGSDTYVVDNAGDVVFDIAGDSDTVRASFSYTLGDDIEHLELIGAAAINGAGNFRSNRILGNSAGNVLSGGDGNDTLDGGGSADVMNGGGHGDLYIVDNAADVVNEVDDGAIDTVQSSVSYTLGAFLDNLALTGASAINGAGNDLANALVGNTAANTLTGGAGNDTLTGGAGIDTMIGGAGDDAYDVDDSADAVTEAAGGGVDSVRSSASYALTANVENLTLTGVAAISGTGNDLANVLTGNSAANVLAGGFGDDVYHTDAGDVVVEASGAGIDIVYSAVSVTIGANIERLVLTGSAPVDATGNDDARNDIAGNDAGNVLRGLGGVDWITAAKGNDLANGGAGNDHLNGGEGIDVLEGGDGDDSLVDDFGNNLYNGGAGADVLRGAAGSELYIGGAGNDVITALGDGADVIAFNRGDGADYVYFNSGMDNTVSLGGGIRYSDLSVTRSGSNLTLKVGATDSITFESWYASGATYKNVLNLQVIAEAMADFNAASTDPLRNRKVTTFDFGGLVNEMDAEPGVTSLVLTDALMKKHLLSGSDSAALGGDIAYRYGSTGSLAGMGFDPVVAMLSSASFGGSAQALQAASATDVGSKRLS